MASLREVIDAFQSADAKEQTEFMATVIAPGLALLPHEAQLGIVETLYPPTKLSRLQSELAGLNLFVEQGVAAARNIIAPFQAAVQNGELSAIAPTIDDLKKAFCQ